MLKISIDILTYCKIKDVLVTTLFYNLPSTAWPVRVATVNMCGSGWPVQNKYFFNCLLKGTVKKLHVVCRAQNLKNGNALTQKASRNSLICTVKKLLI